MFQLESVAYKREAELVELEEGHHIPRVWYKSVNFWRKRDWCFIAEQPAPAPHLAHPEGCAALRIVLVTVPRVSRSCEHLNKSRPK